MSGSAGLLDGVKKHVVTCYLHTMSSAADEARRRRAEQRRGRVTVERKRLGDPDELGPFGVEGMALAWQLSVAAHASVCVSVLRRRNPVIVTLRSRSS